MRKLHLITGVTFIMASFMSSVFAGHHRLDTYAQLSDALRAGDDVRAIISLDKCQMMANLPNTAPPDMTGTVMRMNFSIFNQYKVATGDNQLRYTIATSFSTLTEHRDFGPVQGYGRLRIFEDNTAEIHVAHFDPRIYRKLSELNYICRINDSAGPRGVLLRRE